MDEMPKQVPFEDQCEGALKHYAEVSKEASNWSSIVPEAIRFFRDHKETVEKFESLKKLVLSPRVLRVIMHWFPKFNPKDLD